MADTTMNSATIPNITPAVADWLLVWDASASANGEFQISDLITLLISTFATLAGGNSFTGNQTFANDITAARFLGAGGDLGTGPGPIVRLERNTNASTAAPGAVVIRQAGAEWSSLWPDNSGLWRTAALPSGVTSGDIATGTVVGSQSSSLDAKDVVGEPVSMEDVLAYIGAGAAGVRRFQYKAPTWTDENGEELVGERPNGGEEFSGVIVDYAGRYGTDRDAAHPNGKSLNTINAIGDLLMAVNYLTEQLAVALVRIEALEAAA